MNRLILILSIGLLAIITACSGPAVYDQQMDIEQYQWDVNALATFDVSISDTTSVHHVYINVRNTTDYPYSNLYLFVETAAPSGAFLRDTVEYFLIQNNGYWSGKGFGTIRDNQFPYKRYIRFPEKGTYTFSIQQGMRTHSLEGMASIGIRVEKEKQE